MSDPPSWLNWLSIITGISGVTLSTIVGWIIGGVPPKEPRSYEQNPDHDPNEKPVKRQSPLPRLSLLDEVRWALFKLIIRPDLSITTHFGVTVGGSVALIAASYLHFFGGKQRNFELADSRAVVESRPNRSLPAWLDGRILSCTAAVANAL